MFAVLSVVLLEASCCCACLLWISATVAMMEPQGFRSTSAQQWGRRVRERGRGREREREKSGMRYEWMVRERAAELGD